MNASPYATIAFREATDKIKPMNFPKTRLCDFCGKSETRTCIRHNRCRACNKARS